jgi:hypothetical protein
MEIVLCIVGAAAVGVAIWFVRQPTHPVVDRAMLFKEVAEAHGGHYDYGGSAIELELPGEGGHPTVSMRIEDPSGGSRAHAIVHYPLAAAPEYWVDRELLVVPGLQAKATQRVRFPGDPSFNNAFKVRSNDRKRTRQALTPRARELLAGPLRGSEIHSTAELLEFVGKGAYTEREKLEALIELLGILGGFDFYGHRVLASLDEATFTPVSGKWDAREPPSATLTVQGRPIRIAPVLVEDRAALLASTPNRHRLPSVQSILRRRAVDLTLPSEMVNAETAPLFEALAGASLEINTTELSLSFADRASDAVNEATLRKAAKLLALLGSPTSTYR